MTDPYAQAANQRPIPPDIQRTADEILAATVHAELAALGGHLVATYGDKAKLVEGHGVITHASTLATLGGYLLEHYGQKEDAPQ